MYINAKIMIAVETVSGVGGGVMKESNDGSEFKYNIYDTLQQPL
jgi:hypothetical protein